MKIIIPFRNRFEHLEAWKDIPNVLIVEQAEGEQWNREKLLNCGALECTDNILIFNDIDLVPTRDYPPYFMGVCQLAKSEIQKVDYLGGSTMINRKTFIKSGGFHNEYWGGRAGDNEYFFNLKRLRIPIINLKMSFTEQPHPRPAIEFDPVLWAKAQEPRIIQDQLSICQYKVIGRKEGWIKVEI